MVLLGLSIPFFWLARKQNIYDKDLCTVHDLILIDNPEFKLSRSNYIELTFSGIETNFEISGYELRCVNPLQIIHDFNKGDTVAIRIGRSDLYSLHNKKSPWKRYKVFGLTKEGKQYISLECRNEVPIREAKSAISASVFSLLTTLFF